MKTLSKVTAVLSLALTLASAAAFGDAPVSVKVDAPVAVLELMTPFNPSPTLPADGIPGPVAQLWYDCDGPGSMQDTPCTEEQGVNGGVFNAPSLPLKLAVTLYDCDGSGVLQTTPCDAEDSVS